MESELTPQTTKSSKQGDNEQRWTIRVPTPLVEKITAQAKANGRTIAQELERLVEFGERAEIPRLIQEAVSDSIDSHLIPLAQKQVKDTLAMERTLQDFVFQLRDVLRGESGAKG